ncbi:hypothetical protein ACQEVF_50795 [Nonomuraea polychroma]|uniref:hypothetical protein n=1 Tax=Nonomuraea polychroma TaxID=46176 RepID=UPI003D8F6978
MFFARQYSLCGDRWGARTQRGFDAVTELSEAFSLRVFPDAGGIRRGGRENLLPHGDHAFNAFGPPTTSCGGQPRVAELSAWVNAQCRREALTPGRFEDPALTRVARRPSASTSERPSRGR